MASIEEHVPDHQVESRDAYFLGIKFKNVRTPMVQVAIVGLTAFMTVGMSIALGGAGGGGLLDTTQSDAAGTAVAATFAAVSFFAGTIYNRVGVRICLMFGGFGYAVVVAAFLCTAHILNRATPFVIIAGIMEGFSASLLWAAQGAVCMSYPMEADKGKAFALFWTLFQLGSVIGSIITLCLEWTPKAVNTSDTTYAVFIIIIVIGCFVPLLLSPSNKVIRKDGTHVVVPAMPTWKSEIMGMLRILWEDKWIITIFPFFFSSNYFYTYQGNDYNAGNFTLRTRYFNALWGNLFNMAGAWIMGVALDFKPKRFSRKVRARVGLIFIFIYTILIWGLGWTVVKNMSRTNVITPLVDLDQGARYARYLMLYVFWCFYDGMYQAYAYWLMGSLSNNSQRLSHYAGWYKSFQQAGAAIAYRLDGLRTSYYKMYISTWMILVFGVLSTTWVSFTKVQNHTDDEPIVMGEDKLGKEETIVQVEEIPKVADEVRAV
ncbi:hypothetical protein B7463_g10542, partial [Scytalidium lignicola]